MMIMVELWQLSADRIYIVDLPDCPLNSSSRSVHSLSLGQGLMVIIIPIMIQNLNHETFDKYAPRNLK